MVPYPASLDLPHALVEWVTMLIVTREGDRRCKLPPPVSDYQYLYLMDVGIGGLAPDANCRLCPGCYRPVYESSSSHTLIGAGPMPVMANTPSRCHLAMFQCGSRAWRPSAPDASARPGSTATAAVPCANGAWNPS